MQHRPKTASLTRNPTEQQKPNNQHEGSADPLEKLDGLNSLPNHKHVDGPEKEEAHPMSARKVPRSRPHNAKHRIDCLSSDPRLDAEPSARHQCPKHRRHVRA